jgi:TolB-like protein/Tfp pilus assembly protein PilF
MSSIIEGYNYDIFISYRQKDNKYDGWVTEFVENLKKELEATFKEEIRVYFDINPHDGLLETHDVDASLQEKLKCLVFIPIISQTYCDPKSFAWEHELKTFAEQTSKDRFGLMVKLPNGNVANRILPVRIHDITECDVKLFETITGSFLRGIDFIYKEPGVNRPLRSNEENPHNNLNHTSYRNQVNKVANAIKEVITALEHHGEKLETVSLTGIKTKSESVKKKATTIIIGSIVVLALMILGIFFIPNLKRSEEHSKKSIAVLPFYSLSVDTSNQYLADGMMDAILTHLSKIAEIRVMSRTSVEQYRKTKKTTTEIGKELGVGYILEGSFQKFGDSIRLIVQLIRAGKEDHIWANIYDRHWNNIFSVQSEVAQKIASELSIVLSPEEIEYMSDKPTENLEAYQAYLRGRYYTDQPHFSLQDWNQALEAFQDAVNLDTTFALAYAELARAHARLIFLREDMTESRQEKAKDASLNALRFGSDQPRVQIAIGYYYLYAFRDVVQSLKHFDIAEKSLPNDFDVLSGKAEVFLTEGQWDEHVQFLEKALSINPQSVAIITELAKYYWLTRRLTEAIDAANKAIALSPGSMWPYLYKTAAYWSLKSPDKESRDVLQTVGDTGEWFLWFWYFQEIGEGDLKTALQLADTTKAWGVDNKMFAVPRATLLATIYNYQGEHELALKYYKTAADVLEKKIAEIPDDPRYHSALGITYAGLGRKDDAIHEGLKSVDMLPISKDALYGLGELTDLAIIYTMVGEFDLSLEKLDQLLSLPSWITPAWLTWDIRFEPLKSYPAYKTLMTKYTIGK